MAHRIKESDCICCGVCQPVCPVSCISEKPNGKRLIDEKKCIDCAACAGVCPVSCISHV